MPVFGAPGLSCARGRRGNPVERAATAKIGLGTVQRPVPTPHETWRTVSDRSARNTQAGSGVWA